MEDRRTVPIGVDRHGRTILEEPLAERFWRHVDRSGGQDACWPWIGASSDKRYGSFGIRGKTERAHRVAYRISKGDFDPSLSVCHACDMTWCCNPAHLFLGTHADNMADRTSKMRERRGSAHPCAKLSEESVAEIRVRHARGERYAQLAQEYGVDRMTISRAVRGKGWRHVSAEQREGAKP